MNMHYLVSASLTVRKYSAGKNCALDVSDDFTKADVPSSWRKPRLKMEIYKYNNIIISIHELKEENTPPQKRRAFGSIFYSSFVRWIVLNLQL